MFLLRLGELQKEAVFPRIPSRNGANWVFCDAKKYGIKAATMMYFRQGDIITATH